MVVVRVDYGVGTIVPSHIVPYNTEASHSVDIEVVEREVLECECIVIGVARRTFVAQSQRQRGSRQPVAGKYSVVAVSTRQRNIGIFNLLEFQFGVHVALGSLLAKVFGNDVVQFLPVYA